MRRRSATVLAVVLVALSGATFAQDAHAAGSVRQDARHLRHSIHQGLRKTGHAIHQGFRETGHAIHRGFDKLTGK
jgi:hypothetical protein